MTAFESQGIPIAAVVGGIAFGVFTDLESQLGRTRFMEKAGRIPRSYATPWGCSYSKPDCGLLGLKDQWDAIYQASLVPSADGPFSTIKSVDISPVNNGISYTCADGLPIEQFARLMQDLTEVVGDITYNAPKAKIVIGDYPAIDDDQLAALAASGATQLQDADDYYLWRSLFRDEVCDLADGKPNVRVLYPWGINGDGSEQPVKFKEFRLAEQWNVPGYLGFHPEDEYMEEYALAIAATLEMSDEAWAQAAANVCK